MTANSLFPSGDGSAQRFVAGQKIFERYTLQRLLGQGGMGVVWLARDEELELDVALKFLPSLVVNDRASLNDLKRETRRSLGLTHPNIVRTYDFLQDGTFAGISMEYVDSDTLRNRRIDQPSGVFEPDQLGEWTLSLSDALHYAHKNASIVHRDLKPANLLINGQNHLKVADFGISRSLVESVTNASGSEASSGTLLYMSPQQLEGDPAHALDDVYAMGATLYELCTSRPPFYSGDISRQILYKSPPTMAERRAELGISAGELPKNWEATVAACLAKEPARRPQSAAETAVRLGLKEAAVLSSASFAVGQANAKVATKEFFGALAVPVSRRLIPRLAVPSWGMSRIAWAAVAGVVLLGTAAAFWLMEGRGSRHGTQASNGIVEGIQASAMQASDAGDPGAFPVLQSQPMTADTKRFLPAKGSLFVETDPPGAQVSVDDQPVGKTPLPLDHLTSGTHSLKVLMDGYEDYKSQLDVKDGRSAGPGRIALVRSTGWLNVTTEPAGADLVLTGPDASGTQTHYSSPWNSDKMPTGDYEITATRPGWEPTVKKVSLLRDQSLPVAFDLTGGKVQIDSVPPNATVLLDGKAVGTTPCTLSDVRPGDVKYSLAFEGYGNADVTGKLEAGQVLMLDATLTKVTANPKLAGPINPATVSRSSRTRRSGDDDDNNTNNNSRHHPGDSGRRGSGAPDWVNRVRRLPIPFWHP